MTRGTNPIKIELSEEERVALKKCERRHSTPQAVAQRARIVQLAE